MIMTLTLRGAAARELQGDDRPCHNGPAGDCSHAELVTAVKFEVANLRKDIYAVFHLELFC